MFETQHQNSHPKNILLSHHVIGGDIRERNADTDPDELQRIADEAVSEVRAERYAKGKTDKA